MNCSACGQPIPQGAAVCPVCQTPVNQPVYQQSYARYQQGSYPTGYQQPYAYGQQPAPAENSFLSILAELPRAFVNCFTRPGDVLRQMVERRDLYSCPVVAAVVLILTFLCGIVVMRGFVGVLFGMISAFSGVPLAGSEASMNQGISYIAGRVAPSVGGIAVVCQLISMAVPTIVFLVYICVICKVMFSWELALGFVAVTSLPTVAVALLAMAAALISPWISLILMMCGMAVSYTQACGMLALITGRNDQILMRGKLICVALSVAVTLALCGVAGGLMMGGVVQRIIVLFANVGSLI
ncbi:MAG: zinc ribbon domain-containing protein [Clostridia bacterium]|nr:zinc ribbon domain-containing protein [Clostridia bacterium]